MDTETKELLEDMYTFVGWAVFGAVIGWVISFLAYRGTVVYATLDTYGMFGATLAVFWSIFRRLKHVEHLKHIRRHTKNLEK